RTLQDLPLDAKVVVVNMGIAKALWQDDACEIRKFRVVAIKALNVPGPLGAGADARVGWSASVRHRGTTRHTSGCRGVACGHSCGCGCHSCGSGVGTKRSDRDAVARGSRTVDDRT